MNMSNFILTPSSTGRVFCSTYNSFKKKKRPPTTPLPHDHPFKTFWLDHRFSLSQAGNSDTVIDALIAIQQGRPTWKSQVNAQTITEKRHAMRQVLHQHPPDVVLLTGMDDYGLHYRHQQLWEYICINEDYVDLWMAAKKDTKEHLALTALLRASIDHELGHWIQTLRAGYFSDAALSGSHRSIEPTKNTPTPKSFRAPWIRNRRYGEAGDYVEVNSRGGIIRYSKPSKNAYIVTDAGPEDTNTEFLPISYLREYRSSTDFPPNFISSRRSLKQKSNANDLFPYGNSDRCPRHDATLGHERGCLRIRAGDLDSS